jgi:tetratricopeptide (TPR) repeat protein
MPMKIVLRLLNWASSQVNRQRIILLVGSLALILSTRSAWYVLPPDTLDTFGVSLAIANYYRIIPFLCGLLGLTFMVWEVRGQALRLIFWSGLLIVLLFPCFQVTWNPATTFLANNYYSQNARVDRHVERNFSEIQAQWKQNIVLDEPDTPEPSLNALIKNSGFLQFSSIERFITNILGYNVNFFAYISLNWAIAILGFSIYLFGLYLDKKQRAIELFGRDMKNLLPWILVGFIFLSISILLPNIIHYQLNISYAKGEYRFVQSMSKTLANLYPPLQGDNFFWERLGKSGYYNDQPENSLVALTKGLESYRRKDWVNAETYFQESLNLQPKNFLVRGYLASAILNQGISEFNDLSNRNTATAANSFERVLTVFPNHTEALYDLMLAKAVGGEFDKSADIAFKIIENQKYAQRPRSALLGQAYLHLAWKGFKDKDYQNAWLRYRQSVDDSAWKIVIEEEE